MDLAQIGEYAGVVVAVSGACAIIVNAITKDVKRDVNDVRKDLEDAEHALKNQASRIDAIEHVRINENERIVKLEIAVQSFDKSIERIERGQEKLSDTINDRFDTLAESIREIRSVSPKS